METHFCFVRHAFYFARKQITDYPSQTADDLLLVQSQAKNTSNVKNHKQTEEKEGLIIRNISPQNRLH